MWKETGTYIESFTLNVLNIHKVDDRLAVYQKRVTVRLRPSIVLLFSIKLIYFFYNNLDRIGYLKSHATFEITDSL